MKNIKLNQKRFSIHLKDAYPLFFLVIISIVIQILPSNIRDYLVLNIYAPQVWQFITSIFTHLNIAHLFDNLMFIIFVYLLLFVIASRFNKIRLLNNTFFLTLILVILFSGILNILVLPKFAESIKTNQGLSGLVAGILGAIPIIIFGILIKNKHHLFNLLCLTSSYLGLLGIMIYGFKNISSLIIIGSFVVLLIINLKSYLIELYYKLIKLSKSDQLIDILIILSLLMFIIAPITIFPKEVISQQQKSIVNIFAHYIGVLCGMIASFIAVKFFNK